MTPSISIFAWMVGILIVIMLGIAGALWIYARENNKQHVELSNRVTVAYGELSNRVVAAISRAEIYERTQEKLAETFSRIQERSAENYNRSHESLLKTIAQISEQHGTMFRDLSAVIARLQERSEHQATEIRRVADNVHDVRNQARDADVALDGRLRTEMREQITQIRTQVAQLPRRRNDTEEDA